jgi:hypothetical protein
MLVSGMLDLKRSVMKNNTTIKSNWFKEHADTITIVSTFIACFWMLNSRISVIEKDLTVIKTVLCMKNIMPSELAKSDNQK